MTSVLDRLSHPIRELREWGAHVAHDRAEREAEREAIYQQRHAEYINAVVSNYADAEQMAPRPYRELSAGEVRYGRSPAFEYFHHTGELRLFNIMPADMLTRAALTEALALEIDETGEAYGEFIDVKPHEIPPFEYGAINLTSPALREAHDISCRIYLTITFSAVQGSFRGGIQTRRFIVDVAL